MAELLSLKGGPGSGKTTSGKQLIEQAINDGTDPRQIVATSFTKAAVHELVSRLGLPEDNVGTMHSFGYRQLGATDVLGTDSKATKEWNERHPYWQVGESDMGEMDMDTRARYGEELTGNRMLAVIDFLRQQLTDPATVTPREIAGMNMGLKIQDITGDYNYQAFWLAWQAFKRETGAVDFTDMIEIPYQRNYGAPVAEPSIMWFDEAQDMTPLMRARALQMVEEQGIWTGDEDQCIYPFLGADPAFVVDGEQSFIKMALPTGHRMDKQVHAYSMDLISRIKVRDTSPFNTRANAGDGFVERDTDCVAQEYWNPSGPNYTASRAIALAEQYESVMVLTSCNFMANNIASALRQKYVPYHNPYRLKNGRWNPLKAVAFGMAELLSEKPMTVAMMLNYMRWFKTQGVIKNALKLKAEIEKHPGDMAFTNWESVLVDEIALRTPELMAPKSNYASSVEYAAGILERHSAETLAHPKIIVGTIHSVKGGEADAVILIPELTQSISPTADSTVRQFYVGATRARKHLVLGGNGGRPNATFNL